MTPARLVGEASTSSVPSNMTEFSGTALSAGRQRGEMRYPEGNRTDVLHRPVIIIAVVTYGVVCPGDGKGEDGISIARRVLARYGLAERSLHLLDLPPDDVLEGS